jgi:ribosomal protein S18 acetylase RimI-like enzyme
LLFSSDRLVTSVGLESFACSIPEYNEWLVRDALRSEEDLIATTYLLRERNTGAIVAYMALVADAIKLSVAEKALHKLKYPFKTIPAMKVAKLAVSAPFREKYQGIGSYMIQLALEIADSSNETHFSCRFITVDADIEHDEGLIAFYTKNGFVPNAEMNSKTRKTLNMRRDILDIAQSHNASPNDKTPSYVRGN